MKKFITLFSLLVFSLPTIFANQEPLNAVDSSLETSTAKIESHEKIELDKSIFHNVTGKTAEEGAKIMWAIDYDVVNYLEDNNYSIIIESVEAIYVDKVTKEIKSLAKNRGIDWKVEKGIDIKETSHSIKELKGGTKYVFKIGVTNGENTVFSKPGKFKTERSWGLFRLLVLIGALGMFIYGMKVMSEGLQQAAGDKLRNMLASITSNRVKGVFTGFGITSIVQSSSVTTVMTVSFVNAGLLTLRQSAGVMMGANIGTTITAWLILIFGFKVSLSSYALIFIAFGAPMIFFAKGKMKYWGAAIVGFALLFMGLGELKHSVPSLGADSSIVQFFADFKDAWYGPIMFVFLGAFVTIVIQSSSAAMALTMTMVAAGAIPFEVAAAMILGENIGTTITAELASIIGNVHAKRSARIHSLFNIIGVTWALLLFPFILKAISAVIDGDPSSDPMAANLGLAIFHTSFNTLNVLLLLPFSDKLVTLAERTVKSKGGTDEEFHLDYIGSGLMLTPDLSIVEAKKEVAKFGELTSRMNNFSQQLLTEQDRKTKTKLHEKIAKYEEITDKVEIEVANYLAKVSEGEMTEKASMRVRAMNSIVNDLERIGDIFYQISKTIERKDDKKIYFIPEQRNSLMDMFKLVDNAFEVMVNNLNADWDIVSIDEANLKENAINNKRDEMRKEHFENMQKKDFNMESGMIFSNLFSNLEKVGDHVINVTEAITGQI
jgi:phosphate:Na+ symporter